MVFVYRDSGKQIVLVFANRPRQILGYFPAFYFEILWRALGYYIVIRMETQTKVRLATVAYSDSGKQWPISSKN